MYRTEGFLGSAFDDPSVNQTPEFGTIIQSSFTKPEPTCPFRPHRLTKLAAQTSIWMADPKSGDGVMDRSVQNAAPANFRGQTRAKPAIAGLRLGRKDTKTKGFTF
ncbi:MAG TPA: hypothetical protein VKS24_02730 [Bradyrhizobium sp.]|nr:hypothetical protein [Bradyrhizobium sp.]